MHEAVRQQYEAFPSPSPALEPIGPKQLDRVDDNLHFGWGWHRHQYCYRRGEKLRILDAGCGTGLSTLALARLNPGSAVLGIDVSPRALELAGKRAAVPGAHTLPGAATPGLEQTPSSSTCMSPGDQGVGLNPDRPRA